MPDDVTASQPTPEMKVLSRCFAQLGRWVGWAAEVFLPAEHIRISNLKPEQGTVMRMDGAAVAVYKQSTGALLVFSAHCPDGRGTLSWDLRKKVWICSCHNRAFSPDGQPLSRRGLTPLESIERPFSLRTKYLNYDE